MINYSIVMRPVNSNLIDINMAKGRIKAAKAAGEEPSAEDVALVATEKQNAFAVAQYAEVMTIEKFARHIATHGCVYSRADIAAILYMAVDCMREQLLEGKKIRLGDLGDFSINLTSKGAESADKFTAQNISGVNVVWDCGSEFKNLVKDAEFNLVASRSAQAALIKAIKEGSTSVDLNGTQEDDPNGGGTNTPSGGDSTPSGGNTPSGGISITSIGNQPNGGSLEVNRNPQFAIRGTGLQNLTAANFVNSDGKVGTYVASSDAVAALSYDDINSIEQTISVVVGGETLFTLNIKGNGSYEMA